MSERPTLTTPGAQIECREPTPRFQLTAMCDRIALEGARLIDEFFPGAAENSLLWSPWNGPGDTALVYGDLLDPVEQTELFKTLLRNYFRLAGIRELSYVEYLDGLAGPIWVMVADVYSAENLRVGVNVCRFASLGWSLQQFLKHNRYRKRWLDPTLTLLVPGYPDVDRSRPLSELMLGEQPGL
jgi:hypothetical protein